MYTIQKLQSICEHYSQNNDRDIAMYLLSHLSSIHSISLSRCISDTHISKASIHRFYTKGGFESFKELTHTLEIEYQSNYLFTNPFNKNPDLAIAALAAAIDEASRIYVYGNKDQINQLFYFKQYLKTAKKEYLDITSWDIEFTNSCINSLSDKDVLIIIDGTLSIQNLFEYTMNHSGLLNLLEVNRKKFQKFYIGLKSTESYLGFKNIGIHSQQSLRDIDTSLYYLLEGRKQHE